MTKILSHISGRNIKPLQMSMNDVVHFASLQKIGIDISNQFVRKQLASYGFDAADPMVTVTSPSISAQVQFLQNWLPGFVRVITAARKIDELVGITTSGSWEDEEVVFGILESVGTAEPYSDHSNVPLSDWNVNFVRRTVVRFEKGINVGVLEELRSARTRIDSASEKRNAAALALEIQRNRIGFFGYNNLIPLQRENNECFTYGFLNDPNLPAIGNSPHAWSVELDRFTHIITDLQLAMKTLRTQSGDTIDPGVTPLTLALATELVDYLSTVSPMGISVRDWLNKSYPNIRIVSAPELNFYGAVGPVDTHNLFCLYAETVEDGASDNNRTFEQVVPSKFMPLGVEKRSKSYIEDYANATCGVIIKRPYAVVRYQVAV